MLVPRRKDAGITFGTAAVAVILLLTGSNEVLAVPSFARQTGMACEACHTVFPELTPFGRAFKLNGYLIDNLPQVKQLTAEGIGGSSVFFNGDGHVSSMQRPTVGWW